MTRCFTSLTPAAPDAKKQKQKADEPKGKAAAKGKTGTFILLSLTIQHQQQTLTLLPAVTQPPATTAVKAPANQPSRSRRSAK